MSPTVPRAAERVQMYLVRRASGGLTLATATQRTETHRGGEMPVIIATETAEKREVIANRIIALLLQLGVTEAKLTLPTLGLVVTLKGRRSKLESIRRKKPTVATVAPELQGELARVCARPGCTETFELETGPFGGGGAQQRYCCPECQQATYRLRASAKRAKTESA